MITELRILCCYAATPALTTCNADPRLVEATTEHTVYTEANQDPTSRASKNKPLESFRQAVPGTDIAFDMVAIPGGTFTMGSAADENGRRDDEGPVRRIEISPFWIGKHEVRWEEYEQWMFSLERDRRPGDKSPKSDADRVADAVTRPTPPYTDMTFGMGREGYPAICMTQLAATTYCEWLSAKSGRKYRLPTEAEWEYACRAGTTTRYSFGDDESALGDYAWFGANSDDQYQPVGQKKPNPWGLFDMHGNVAEWVQDQHSPYVELPGKSARDPVVAPKKLYPRVVRGGSWEDPARSLRSAARAGSEEDWKMQDPQIPQSVWYHTDALFVGFRVVCTP